MNIKNIKYTKYKNTKLFYIQLNDIYIHTHAQRIREKEIDSSKDIQRKG